MVGINIHEEPEAVEVLYHPYIFPPPYFINKIEEPGDELSGSWPTITRPLLP